MTEREPTTEAGKRLTDWLNWAKKRWDGVPSGWQVADVEAEAAADDRAWLAVAVRGLPCMADGMDCGDGALVGRWAVLALLEAPR